MKPDEVQPYLNKFIKFMSNETIDSKMIYYFLLFIKLTQGCIEEYRQYHPEFVPKSNTPSDEWKYNFNICKNAHKNAHGLLSGQEKLDFLNAYASLVKELLLQEEFSDLKREEQIVLLAFCFCDIPKEELRSWLKNPMCLNF